MDKLIETSNILYNKDIYDKTKEIKGLKNIYNTPHIFFNNYNEWKKRKERLLNNIRLKLNGIIDKEYMYMYYHGFTINLKMGLNTLILNELENLTKNKSWSNNISTKIVFGIETFIMSLVKSNTWYIIYNIGKKKLIEIIYENIEWHLCNMKYWPEILDEIPKFKCKNCGKLDNYVNLNNICVNCE